jgi:hypothetical protein
METTEERLAGLEARVRLLEDKEAIRRVICRWGPACDAWLPEEAAAIWTDDGLFITDVSRAEGAAEIMASFDGNAFQDLVRSATAHVHGVPLITVDGDEASAIDYSRLYRHTGAGYEIERVSANEWKFRRTLDGWRVMSREVAAIDGGQGSRDILKRAYAQSGS